MVCLILDVTLSGSGATFLILKYADIINKISARHLFLTHGDIFGTYQHSPSKICLLIFSFNKFTIKKKFYTFIFKGTVLGYIHI